MKRATAKHPINLLKKHYKLLQHIGKCSKEDCEHVMKGVSDEVIKLMCQICVNVMNKGLTRNPQEAVRRLAPYKKQLKGLTKAKTSIGQKRRQLEQKGGFIGALLGIALPVISSIIAATKRR